MKAENILKLAERLKTALMQQAARDAPTVFKETVLTEPTPPDATGGGGPRT